MIKRNRKKQTVPFSERLGVWAKRVQAEAEKFPPGSPEREGLLKKVRQADTASHLDEWANSPGLQSPT